MDIQGHSTNRLVEAMDTLRHMVGAQAHIPRRDWFSRNYFNSSDCGPDVDLLVWMHTEGLVSRGRPNYWHATTAGCNALARLEPVEDLMLHCGTPAFLISRSLMPMAYAG